MPASAHQDSCGCATGAKFLAVGFVAAALWYGCYGRAFGLSLTGIAVRIFLWSLLAAGLGKSVGIALSALRRPRFDR